MSVEKSFLLLTNNKPNFLRLLGYEFKKVSSENTSKKGLITSFQKFGGWDSFRFSGLISGRKIIDEGYGSNIIVYSIINKIQTSASYIDWLLINKDTDEEITEGRFYNAFQKPELRNGKLVGLSDFRERLSIELLSGGNAFLRKELGEAMLTDAFEFLPQQFTYVKTSNSFLGPVLGYNFHDKTKNKAFSAEEVLHSSYFNPTTKGLGDGKGLSPIMAGALTLEGSKDVQKALSVVLKNQGVRGILAREGNYEMSPDEKVLLQAIKKAELQGVENINGFHISGTLLKWIQMGLSPADLELMKSGVMTDRQLCNAYSVSSSLFNDPENKTFNNVKEAKKALYTDAVLPLIKKQIDFLEVSWLPEWRARDGVNYGIKPDVSKIEALQQDKKAEAEKAQILAKGIIEVLKQPISREAKIQTLIFTHRLDEERATLIVDDGVITKLPEPEITTAND